MENMQIVLGILIFGMKKYDKYVVDEIELRLSKIFPYWYKQIKNALEKEGLIANNPQFV